MNVTLPAITAWVPDSSGGSVFVSYAGGVVTIAASHASLPRVSFIELRSGGTVAEVAGTPTAETGSVLEAPMGTLSANAIMLCKVKVGGAVTVIGTDKVYGRAHDISEQYAFRVPKGSDLASAAALTLPDSSAGVFDVTGTTTVTSISSRPAGAIVIFQFDGALILTYNATTLVLANAVNYTTKAGDIFGFVSEGSGNWRELFRRPAEGGAAAWEHIDTQVLAGTATSVSFQSIPTDFKMFRLTFHGLASGTADLRARLNNDSGANYDYGLASNGGASAATNAAAQWVLGSWTNTAAIESLLARILISKPTAGEDAIMITDVSSALRASAMNIYNAHGNWRNVADLISRIDLLISTGNLEVGTRVTLEGIRTPN